MAATAEAAQNRQQQGRPGGPPPPPRPGPPPSARPRFEPVDREKVRSSASLIAIFFLILSMTERGLFRGLFTSFLNDYVLCAFPFSLKVLGVRLWFNV